MLITLGGRSARRRPPAVEVDALAGRRWLLREPGSGTRLANEQFLASAGVPAETLTLGSNGAIKQAARAGLGISFVSRDAVAHELASGVLGIIPVASGPPARAWYAMHSTVGPARPLVAEFMDVPARRHASQALV